MAPTLCGNPAKGALRPEPRNGLERATHRLAGER